MRPSGPDAAGTGRPVRNNAAVSVDRCVCVGVCPHLDVIVVSDVFVSRGDARLDRLYPRLAQLLRLSLQHAAPAETTLVTVA